MKINWKVRMKSPAFWTGIIGAVVLFLKESLGLNIDDSLVNSGINILLLILSATGITVDPTTHGFTDSEQALEYNKPKKDEVE